MKEIIMKNKVRVSALMFIIICQTIISCSFFPRVSDSASAEEIALTTTIPTGGNSWIVNDFGKNNIVSNQGVHNWIDLSDVIRTYFYVNKIGKIGVGVNIKSPEGALK